MWAAVIAALTLRPGPADLATMPAWCIVCGDYGLADAVLNVLLFLPLGVGLGLFVASLARAIAPGALMSLVIELTQMRLPGRDASLGDLLTNSLGTALGVMLARERGSLLLPSRNNARRLLSGWTAVIVLTTMAVAVLLRPALPASTWYSQWTAELGQFARYDGRVVTAELARIPLQPGRIGLSVRERLLAGAPLDVRFLAGTPPPSLAPIFSIFDERQREIIVLGAAQHGLVVRYRNLAAALRLDVPELVVPQALAHVRPGDTVRLTLSWQHPAFRISVDGRRYETGPSLTHAPALLLRAQHLFWHGVGPLPAIWMATLFLPFGLWVSSRWDLRFPAIAGLAVLALPLILPLEHTRPELVAGAALGTAAGWLAQYAFRHRRPAP